jgi:hypothetical protein
MLRPSGIVHQSAYYRVEVLAIPRVVKVTRLARPFESAEAVNIACDPVQAALDAAGRRSHRLLIDTREAVGNNDTDYEKWFEVHRRRMLLGFPRVALIAKSAIGKLHVDRLVAAEKLEKTPRVFLDEGLAMRYLAEE